MLCDLHIHSGYSSGTQTLDEIADEALIVALMPDHPELSVQDYRAHRKVRGEGGFKHSSYLRSKGLRATTRARCD